MREPRGEDQESRWARDRRGPGSPGTGSLPTPPTRFGPRPLGAQPLSPSSAPSGGEQGARRVWVPCRRNWLCTSPLALESNSEQVGAETAPPRGARGPGVGAASHGKHRSPRLDPRLLSVPSAGPAKPGRRRQKTRGRGTSRSKAQPRLRRHLQRASKYLSV